ncbi:MAG: patatin-like phospholipase family protein [Archangiaceae bacterium]|nr:patatin-like phospholipase family protein [Archangiaceae bacterium]
MIATPRIGLVASGGGARGAYEAGVIRYLREELKTNVRFDVLCGTSVGAMTACFLATTMDRPAEQGRELAEIWESLSLERVFKVEGEDLFTITRKMWRAARDTERPEGWRIYDVLHPEALEEMVRTRTSWPRISANLAKGLFSALSVTATRINDGRTVVFVQRREPGLPAWSRDPNTEARETIIGPEHALASGAIPLLFRSVRIGEEFFCDGSVRQNTPLSPALRLGADRVLILTLKHRPEAPAPVRPMRTAPSTLLLVGKVLNALMLDHTEYDLDRLRRFNALLAAGKQAFGDEFLSRMNDAIREQRGSTYRPVRELVIRPSRDLAEVAADLLRKRKMPVDDDPLPARWLRRFTQSQLFTQADLASYLLFDGAYAKALIQMGMDDAHAQRAQLAEFFDPEAPA